MACVLSVVSGRCRKACDWGRGKNQQCFKSRRGAKRAQHNFRMRQVTKFAANKASTIQRGVRSFLARRRAARAVPVPRRSTRKRRA